MNQTTITAIIGIVSVLLASASAAWLNQRAVKDQIDQQSKFIKELLEQQTKTIDAKLETIHTHISAVEQRLDRLERQFDLAFKPTLSKTGD